MTLYVHTYTARTRRRLAIAMAMMALTACNDGRGTPDPEADAATTDVMLDAEGDTTTPDVDEPDADEPDLVSVDIGIDAEPDTDPEPDVVFVDAGTEDVAPDTIGPATDAPLVVYAVEEDGRHVLQVVPADGSRAPYTAARFEDYDLSRPAFSPSGEQIAFLYANDDGEVGVGIVSLVHDGPAQLVGDQGLLELYDVEWAGDDTLHITAFGPADQIRDAVVTVFALPLFDPVGPYPVVHPGATGQVLSAYVAPETGFGYYYLRVEDPPHGDIWFDTQGGMIPTPQTADMPIAGDFVPLSEEQFLFTDGGSRAYLGTLRRGERTEEFEMLSPGGVEDFHPRPLLTGTHFVSARYPEEVSARPTDRDLVLVSMETGEVVTRITNTPRVDEFDPDVQASATWRP